MQEQQKVLMAALIEKLNDLFGTETSEQDQLRYVNGTILGKVAESAVLQQQAANNTKEQFANSPNLTFMKLGDAPDDERNSRVEVLG